ncbi:MAG: hypothetical protein AAF222_09485 [Pseudomonadota bacterium]
MNDADSAIEIANDLLEKTGDAMQAGEFQRFRDCFAVPFLLETFEYKRLLRTEAELESVFDAVRQFRELNHITFVIRENVAAQYVRNDTISATHVSRMVQRGDMLFGRPFPTYSLIKNIDGCWRLTFSQYAIEESHGLIASLTP